MLFFTRDFTFILGFYFAHFPFLNLFIFCFFWSDLCFLSFVAGHAYFVVCLGVFFVCSKNDHCSECTWEAVPIPIQDLWLTRAMVKVILLQAHRNTTANVKLHHRFVNYSRGSHEILSNHLLGNHFEALFFFLLIFVYFSRNSVNFHREYLTRNQSWKFKYFLLLCRKYPTSPSRSRSFTWIQTCCRWKRRCR